VRPCPANAPWSSSWLPPGYDGGWTLGEPYVIVLANGGNGITYRIASRTACPEASATSGAGSRPTTRLLACQTGR
jgi:hypothetical protein